MRRKLALIVSVTCFMAASSDVIARGPTLFNRTRSVGFPSSNVCVTPQARMGYRSYGIGTGPFGTNSGVVRYQSVPAQNVVRQYNNVAPNTVYTPSYRTATRPMAIPRSR
jgi:hypothetical protein